MARSDQASGGVAVTPSDVTNIAGGPTFGLYVGGAGNVTAVMLSGEVVLFTAVPAGSLLPIQVTRVNATGTTATAMVALKQ
jgi:hypothetical protein